MIDCNTFNSPSDPNNKLVTSTNDEDVLVDVPYQEAIGSLLYISQGTRPGISYSVNMLSRFNSRPGSQHWAAVKRVMRYLKGTQNFKLVFAKHQNENVIGFCDADWASNTEDRRSCTGYVFMFQGAAISWSSRRQQTVALSTMEAEYMSLGSATQEAVWLKQLEDELWPHLRKVPITLYCDNQNAIKLASTDAFHARSKHIDVRFHFLRNKIAAKKIDVKFVGTDEMTADILTKATFTPKHQYCTNKMGLHLRGDDGNKC
ncbi:uncharacterized protein LOC129945033 [Eupeodes corollae]|uniref:uncharacterized protein LOC129945033 n=1 Tax=Eupeodes corollae TaxID=290404 RepID=UPI002492620D|nr:uncharacterized protein LOC129945033 [Eupeodes corollae]